MYYDLNRMTAAFDRLSRHDSPWTTFHSILDFFLLPHRYYPTGEELAAAHQQLLAWPDKEIIVEFLTAMTDLQPEGFQDPLGEFYMMNISHGRLGQYFTPEHVCDMMAQINVGNDPQPGQTVLDPACGSGRTLLAVAKINRHLHFYGADLDPICCKMALVNMLLNSLTGEIANMNSLSNEFYRGYKVRTLLVGEHYQPYFLEFTDPQLSRIWLRVPTQPDAPEPTTPQPAEFHPVESPLTQQPLVQGSLF